MAMHVEERFQRGLHLRHRRRGRLDPDRRGAHAAHHLGPGRGPHRDLLPHERGGAAAHAAEGGEEAGPARAPGDFWVDEKNHQVAALGGRPREGRGDPRRASACCRRARACTSPPTSTSCTTLRRAARALPVPPRPALRGAERRGGHRRRVHRPPDAGPALVRRPAPGGRGEGEACRSRTRTRRSPRSPSRTTSACTASSPA